MPIALTNEQVESIASEFGQRFSKNEKRAVPVNGKRLRESVRECNKRLNQTETAMVAAVQVVAPRMTVPDIRDVLRMVSDVRADYRRKDK